MPPLRLQVQLQWNKHRSLTALLSAELKSSSCSTIQLLVHPTICQHYTTLTSDKCLSKLFSYMLEDYLYLERTATSLAALSDVILMYSQTINFLYITILMYSAKFLDTIWCHQSRSPGSIKISLSHHEDLSFQSRVLQTVGHHTAHL